MAENAANTAPAITSRIKCMPQSTRVTASVTAKTVSTLPSGILTENAVKAITKAENV